MEGMDEILKEFIVESYEGLDQLDRDLVTLEEDPSSSELMGRIFRTIHTIKGSSGFLALQKLEKIAHVGENLLSLLRDDKLSLSAEITTALLAMADTVREIIDHVEREQCEGSEDYAELIEVLTQLAQSEQVDKRDPAEGSPDAAPGRDAQRASPTADGAEGRGPSISDSTIRVDVGLLDTLMNLVGELVLARNQIVQYTATQEDVGFTGTSQRLNLITTELQEGVMKTRMQPIGNVWSKFPRVVRDLSLSCAKKVRVEMEGRDTELDKTIIESIKDPLTHMIRNAVDHGIEMPDVRRERGKPEGGRILLRAFHEGGQVNIEISDDGGGIDPEKVKNKAISIGLVSSDQAAQMSEKELVSLVTMPGFSTAEKVTNVSGRGVGMDVVKTNIEKIGGVVDIQSALGEGTTLKIKIPLTLAIIPALIVTNGGDRFAIPQVNLLELVRLEGIGGHAKIESVHGSPVYRLRGNLLPLAHLDKELGTRGDRERHADGESGGGGQGDPSEEVINIVVLQAGDRPFGLVVESILDTEEIVVKPLGKQLKSVPAFAGTAIMGDGRVALILDVMGVAQTAGIISENRHRGVADQIAGTSAASGDSETLLLLEVRRGGRAAIRLSIVSRLEEFDANAVERAAGREVVQYRGEIMPLIRLSGVMGHDDHLAEDAGGKVQVVVVRAGDGRHVGLAVDRIVDVVEEDLGVASPSAHDGISRAIAVQGRVSDLLDVEGIIREALPGFAESVQLTEVSV